MQTVAVCCLKNEADIVEPLVRHTCRVVDRMIVLDDGSLDESRAILQQLVAEGLPLELIERHASDNVQHRRMTRLVCEEAAVRLQADWIVAIDADEFLCLPPGELLIPPDLSRDTCLSLPWRCHVTSANDDAAELNPAIRLRYRREQEPHPTFKVIVPGELARRHSARIDQGNHHFWIGEQRCEEQSHPSAWLAHLPLRSPSQYLIRIAGTWLTYLSLPDRHPDWGWSSRVAFEEFKRDPERLVEFLVQESLQYGIPHARELQLALATVHDPLPYLGGPLRLTKPPLTILESCAVVLRMAEELALRQAVSAAAGSRHMADNGSADKGSADTGSADTGGMRLRNQTHILATLQSTLNDRDLERSKLIALCEQFKAQIVRNDRELANERIRHEGSLTELANTRTKHNNELLALASEHAINYEQKLQDLEQVKQELARERNRHAQIIQSFQDSWSWRLGRTLLTPVRLVRQSWIRSFARSITVPD